MNTLKSLIALATIAGFAVVAQPGAAEAQCASCNVPIAKTNVRTITKTRTVQQVRNVTKVKNVTRNRYVKNVTRYVTRTIIVPVTRVNTITRVHNRTFVINTTQNVTGGSVTGGGRTITGWSRTENVNHGTVSVRYCGRCAG